MRIEFMVEGGIAHFPGLARPVVIESEALPEMDAAELVRLLEAARFFERPAPPAPPVRGRPTIGSTRSRRRTAIGGTP